MGRHAAGELAVTESDQLNGVIIESGRPNLGRFADGLAPDVIKALEDDYHAKFYSIDIPALVIHGEWDELAPLQDAVDMHDNFKTRQQAPGNHPQRRPQRPHVRRLPAILRRNPRLHHPLRPARRSCR